MPAHELAGVFLCTNTDFNHACAHRQACSESITSPAGSVLPPILAAYLPPALSERRRALEQGAWLPPTQKPSEAAPLRGTLALLLRSVASPDPERNYCSLATASEPRAAGQWRCQSWRLLLCCAALLGGPPAPPTDLLLQAAAARTVAVLLDELQWKCYPAGVRGQGLLGLRVV